MDAAVIATSARLPRVRRASEPPAFRLTDDDVAIVRQLARHRFLRSTHIAALAGPSLDRTNDRLSRLFHSGYLDRPRAQLDYYPTSGSLPFVYALADRGARLLIERDGIDFAKSSGAARTARPAGRSLSTSLRSRISMSRSNARSVTALMYASSSPTRSLPHSRTDRSRRATRSRCR
jgi:hypothetical protein